LLEGVAFHDFRLQELRLPRVEELVHIEVVWVLVDRVRRVVDWVRLVLGVPS